MIQNPILPGFYPDPSICRVGDDFYMVTSSFSYFPGVPIFHSRDLKNWEQIGHVLDRPSQLWLTYEDISAGIFAPTIRYHDGIFYMITTNMTGGPKNFIVTATDPAGPWSEPYMLETAHGIDPSLFFDDDGRMYFTGTRVDHGNFADQYIWCCEVDPKTLKLIGEGWRLWAGALKNTVAPEAPHLYKKDGWYYLMIAEGGTEHFHAVTISRSRDLHSEFQGYEGNPILTHRHLGKMYPICNPGHADIVELKDGSWYMVMLASRIYGGYHKILGRETFITPMTWEDGWPVVNPGVGHVEMECPQPDLAEYKIQAPYENIAAPAVKDDFDGSHLGLSWNFLGTPYEEFSRIENSRLYLKLLDQGIVPMDREGLPYALFERFGQSGKTKKCVSFVGRRQQHMNCSVTVKMEFLPEDAQSAGITVIQNEAHQLRIQCRADGCTGRVCIEAAKTVSLNNNGKLAYQTEILGSHLFESGSEWYLKICAKGIYYSFYAGCDSDHMVLLAENVDGGFLGSETSGGFVGAYIGMFASSYTVASDGLHESDKNSGEKWAAFDWFEYMEG